MSRSPFELSRRRFVVASTLAAGGALAAVGCSLGAAQNARAATGDVVGSLVDALDAHSIVAMSEPHGMQEFHDTLLLALVDARVADRVNSIVVEFGNALYQSTVDRFLSGQVVANTDLRVVWRNTTQSPLETWDAPVYENFYRWVRALNMARPSEKRIRVVLGDPPIDWSRATAAQVRDALLQRDTHMSQVATAEALKGRRVLFVAGGGHLARSPDPGSSVVSDNALTQVERKLGKSAYVIGSPYEALYRGALVQQLASYAHPSVVEVAGSSLADLRTNADQTGTTLGRTLDALLYLGDPGQLTNSNPNPAIYLDPVYWAELQRRHDLLPGPLNPLAHLRQEQPAVYNGR